MDRTLYITEHGHKDLLKTFTPVAVREATYTISAISLSDSIEHAMTSIACDILDNMREITVYRARVSLPCPDIIGPEILYKQGWLDRALYTREHWCLVPLYLEGEHRVIDSVEFSTYRVPDDNKVNDLRAYILEHARRLSMDDILLIHQLCVDDLIRRFLPMNMDRLQIDPENAANYIDLTTIRTISKVRYADEKFN